MATNHGLLKKDGFFWFYVHTHQVNGSNDVLDHSAAYYSYARWLSLHLHFVHILYLDAYLLTTYTYKYMHLLTKVYGMCVSTFIFSMCTHTACVLLTYRIYYVFCTVNIFNLLLYFLNQIPRPPFIALFIFLWLLFDKSINWWQHPFWKCVNIYKVASSLCISLCSTARFWYARLCITLFNKHV